HPRFRPGRGSRRKNAEETRAPRGTRIALGRRFEGGGSMKKVFVSLLAAAAVAACSSSDEHPTLAPPAPAPTPGVSADQVEVVHGVPDRDRDPAVIAIDIGERALCTGSLIAPTVVLTARHCVARTSEQVQCPATGPQVGSDYTPSSLHVIVGDDVSV